jgi:two-component system sensor histidine kinase CpxA
MKTPDTKNGTHAKPVDRREGTRLSGSALSVGRRQLQLGHLLHEIRAPLARMRVAVDLINGASKIEPGDVRRLCLEIERIEKMMIEVIGWNRLPQIMQYESMITYSLSDVMNQLIQDLKYEATSKELTICATIEPGIDYGGDKVWITRSLENIMRNALHYSPPKGEIIITLQKTASVIRAVITDRGPGVPKKELEKIFEPFVTGSVTSVGDSSQSHQGLGLGLSIVKTVVRLHGGQAWAEATDRGFNVCIELPVHAPVA